jgi:tetratricopeptide (TPR) repeat protein
MNMHRRVGMAAAIVVMGAGLLAQTPARQQIARGIALWDQRLSKSAIAALETAARSRPTPTEAAEIHEALGRIYTFKGWQQESVFPGWHDEPGLRTNALAELKAAVAADPTCTSAQEALRAAEGFAAADAVEPAPPRPEVRALDAKLQSMGSDPKSGSDPVTVAAIVGAVNARAQAQADPAPYFAGAQILIDRGEYESAIALAERGATASDTFIDENLGAYQLSGKSQGSYARGRGTAADLVGWALFLKQDYPAARAKLEESARLSQDQDFVNQVHLGELARTQSDAARAREHYLNALSMAGGPAPLRQRATQALSGLHAGGPNAATGFDAWLDAELTRRRDERRTAALKSLVDRPLPKLTLTTVGGKPFDTSSLQGKVVLLNFFASW